VPPVRSLIDRAVSRLGGLTACPQGKHTHCQAASDGHPSVLPIIQRIVRNYADAVTVTGIPLRTALPESGSIDPLSVRMLELTPGRADATAI